MTKQHLDRYLAEFDWRYSSRKMIDADRTELTIRKTAGEAANLPLTYERRRLARGSRGGFLAFSGLGGGGDFRLCSAASANDSG